MAIKTFLEEMLPLVRIFNALGILPLKTKFGSKACRATSGKLFVEENRSKTFKILNYSRTAYFLMRFIFSGSMLVKLIAFEDAYESPKGIEALPEIVSLFCSVFLVIYVNQKTSNLVRIMNYLYLLEEKSFTTAEMYNRNFLQKVVASRAGKVAFSGIRNFYALCSLICIAFGVFTFMFMPRYFLCFYTFYPKMLESTVLKFFCSIEIGMMFFMLWAQFLSIHFCVTIATKSFVNSIGLLTWKFKEDYIIDISFVQTRLEPSPNDLMLFYKEFQQVVNCINDVFSVPLFTLQMLIQFSIVLNSSLAIRFGSTEYFATQAIDIYVGILLVLFMYDFLGSIAKVNLYSIKFKKCWTERWTFSSSYENVANIEDFQKFSSLPNLTINMTKLFPITSNSVLLFYSTVTTCIIYILQIKF